MTTLFEMSTNEFHRMRTNNKYQNQLDFRSHSHQAVKQQFHSCGMLLIYHFCYLAVHTLGEAMRLVEVGCRFVIGICDVLFVTVRR